MSNPPFFMACRSPSFPGAKTEPRVRYPTLEAARAAAQKLANQTSNPFTILAATETVKPKDTNQKDMF